ncbi:MAG: ABC transporter ATP-binding protein [Chloroflexi bacterium RBG_13_50_10]|nr:MAG: ABC transporter ATP-binding protein [Chloroflexi bacterium RBG_13_50_10]
MLEIRDVVKDFEGIRAVNHCSFHVKRGAITGLIGPNGAGKTTLFNLITGFLKCTSGQIFSEGERIDGLPPHDIFRRGIVRTFQIPRELKRMTVIENLMLVPGRQIGEHIWGSWFLPWRVQRQEQEIEARAIDVLRFVNLIHLKNEYADNLSSGQKKLLELARTLMAEPQLVLLDEPGAGVNPTLLNQLVEDIRRSCAEKNLTFLVIEHDMDLIMRLCNPIIVISNGQKIMEGSPYEVQRDQRVLEAYLGGLSQ